MLTFFTVTLRQGPTNPRLNQIASHTKLLKYDTRHNTVYSDKMIASLATKFLLELLASWNPFARSLCKDLLARYLKAHFIPLPTKIHLILVLHVVAIKFLTLNIQGFKILCKMYFLSQVFMK